MPTTRRPKYVAATSHGAPPTAHTATVALYRNGAPPEPAFFGRGTGAAPLVDLAGEEEVQVLARERVEMMDLTGGGEEEEGGGGGEARPWPPIKLESD